MAIAPEKRTGEGGQTGRRSVSGEDEEGGCQKGSTTEAGLHGVEEIPGLASYLSNIYGGPTQSAAIAARRRSMSRPASKIPKYSSIGTSVLKRGAIGTTRLKPLLIRNKIRAADREYPES
jgi:hypothetical protein